MVTGGEIQLGGTKGTFYGFSIINPLLRFFLGGWEIILFKEMRHNL